MTRQGFGRFGGRLAAVAAVGPLVPAAVALAQGGLEATLSTAVAAGLAAAGGVLTLTRPVRRLAAAADRIAGGEPAGDLPAGGDEVGRAAAAISGLEGRLETALEERDEVRVELNKARVGMNNALAELAAGLARVAAGTGPTDPPELGLPAGVSGDKVLAEFRGLTEKVGGVRQRLQTAVRILQGCPDGVALIDDRGGVRYLNPAAEQALGRETTKAFRHPLDTLVRAAGGDPLGRPPLPAGGVSAWLAAGGGAVVAEAVGTGRRLVLTAAKMTPGADSAWTVVARDADAENGLLAADRAWVRAEVLAAAWTQADRAAGGAGEVIAAQARLLTGDAKQSGQRDLLMPRIAAVAQQANHLNVHFRIQRWLAAVLWGDPPAPVPVEFLAGESVRAAVDQMALRLQARNLTVSLADQGGWVCCDEEWLRTAVLGALAHACAAGKDGVIGVKVRRLPGLDGQREGRVAVEVIDAGPPLTEAQRAALDAPFGGLTADTVLTAGGDDAYLPGLLLAGRLAAALGGGVEFDATPSGRLVVRLTVPSWLPEATSNAPPAAPAAGVDGGAFEELCHGWKLGTAV